MAQTADASAAPVSKAIPPYMPYKTFINTIAGWSVALPNRIDRSVLGSYSGAMQSWMMSTLRYFALITGDGIPTDKLRHLTHTTANERQQLLVELLRYGYPFLFQNAFDLSKATPSQLREKFKDTGAQGSTLVKSLSFFLAMAKDAGIPLSPYLKMRQRTSGSNGRKANANRPKRQIGGGVPLPPSIEASQTKTAFQVLYELLDPDQMEEQEEQAVWTLLRYLKKKGNTS